MLLENKKKVSAVSSIEILWREGFFKKMHTLGAVSQQITERFGHNFPLTNTSKALKASSFLTRTGKRGLFHYIQKTSPISNRVKSIEEDLFSDELVGKLGKSFETEMKDLYSNFGNSGTCTAFLLRKILEKLICIVFTKKGIAGKIEDKNFPGGFVGLERMVSIASQEKIQGLPILTVKTTQKIQGVKFLGDTSAHNPLVNVDMETIIPQMPFIITAYKELAERL